MSNLISHARAEFRAAGWTDENGNFTNDMQRAICEHVEKLLTIFDDEGHSGSSAHYAVDLFEKLALFKPIVPITGEAWEWNEVGEGIYQNKRCSHVFKDPARFNGQAYDIEAVVFWEWHKDELTGERTKVHFTSRDSAQPITFPYTPKRVYKQRRKSIAERIGEMVNALGR